MLKTFCLILLVLLGVSVIFIFSNPDLIKVKSSGLSFLDQNTKFKKSVIIKNTSDKKNKVKKVDNAKQKKNIENVYLNTKNQYKIFLKHIKSYDIKDLSKSSNIVTFYDGSRHYNIQCFEKISNMDDFQNAILATMNIDWLKKRIYRKYVLFTFTDPNQILYLWENDNRQCSLLVNDRNIRDNYLNEKILEILD